MDTTLGYLGPKGTNSETAAQFFSKDKGNLKGYLSIKQLFSALENEECTYIVMPIENSTEGSVTEVLDTWLHHDSIYISDAYLMQISYNLYTLRPIPLAEIKTISSHPQCYAQSQEFISKECPHAHFLPSISSAHAIENLKNIKDPETAAVIANQQFNTKTDIHKLAENIETQKDNCTFFGLLSKKWIPKQSHQFLSLAFTTLENSPGSLSKVLSYFSKQDVNLSRIISRPSKKSFGDYIFYIDIECAPNKDLSKTLIKQIRDVTAFSKILGSYSL